MPERARISVYAQGRDYHDTVKKALKALARWLVEAEAPGEAELKVFVDTAPVMEKPLGQAAGLGWQGKHTNLVSREHGSWLFLGAIYTTLRVRARRAARATAAASCNACQRRLPDRRLSRALPARCAALHLVPDDRAQRADPARIPRGDRQPHLRLRRLPGGVPVEQVRRQRPRANRAFLPRAELAAPRLAELLALDDAGFRQLFSGSPIKRIGRNRFVRNCLIAAGNSGNAGAARAGARRWLDDPDPVVAEAARWALGRAYSSSLSGTSAIGQRSPVEHGPRLDQLAALDVVLGRVDAVERDHAAFLEVDHREAAPLPDRRAARSHRSRG